MLNHTIAVATQDKELIERAKSLAKELHLAFIFNFQKSKTPLNYHYLLMVTFDYLALVKTSDPEQKRAFHLDFLSGKMRKRLKEKGLRREWLARAIGAKPCDQLFIVDATAGLGRDSFMLASLGFEITMLERSPILYTLLQDALSRAKQDEGIVPIIERMHLIHTDAVTWFSQALKDTLHLDIIYLDPMFPERKKSASVKKEMAILQEFLGKDDDSARLFEMAIACARRRVVVKRPRLAPFITKDQPDFSIKGKRSRFDIYLAKHK